MCNTSLTNLQNLPAHKNACSGTMDKMKAWEELHFDVMFHGSDWKGSEMYNRLAEQFRAVGADIVFLPHTAGISSTILSDVLHKLQEDTE